MEIFKKKIAGVPILYLALLGVGVLAFIAWRMKPASGAPSEPTATTDPNASTDPEPIDGGDYGQFATTGTVTVSQPGSPQTVTPIGVQSNEQWARNAANWLVAQGLAGGGTALDTMMKYIAGDQLSFDEGKLRDAAIRQFGVPPEPLTSGGTATPTPTAPIREANPPVVHTVRGPDDNNLWKISNLFYGTQEADHVNFLEFHNPQWVRATIPVGSKVKVPVYVKRTYIVPPPHAMTTAQIATKGFTTPQVIAELNDKPINYVYPVNFVVRMPS